MRRKREKEVPRHQRKKRRLSLSSWGDLPETALLRIACPSKVSDGGTVCVLSKVCRVFRSVLQDLAVIRLERGRTRCAPPQLMHPALLPGKWLVPDRRRVEWMRDLAYGVLHGVGRESSEAEGWTRLTCGAWVDHVEEDEDICMSRTLLSQSLIKSSAVMDPRGFEISRRGLLASAGEGLWSACTKLGERVNRGRKSGTYPTPPLRLILETRWLPARLPKWSSIEALDKVVGDIARASSQVYKDPVTHLALEYQSAGIAPERSCPEWFEVYLRLKGPAQPEQGFLVGHHGFEPGGPKLFVCSLGESAPVPALPGTLEEAGLLNLRSVPHKRDREAFRIHRWSDIFLFSPYATSFSVNGIAKIGEAFISPGEAHEFVKPAPLSSGA